MIMTKDEILTDVDDLIKSLMDTGPMGQVYNDGFKDGAKYVLQKLQQTPCTTLLPKIQQFITNIEAEQKSYPRMFTCDVIRLLKKLQELAEIA